MRYWFLIIILIITFACSKQESKISLSNPEEPTREELRNAMRFHGILIAKQDENHEWYFMREGKRCPLFAYLKKQRNKQNNASENNS
ncbi:MAG: hypothetical protein OS130_14865 [Thermodesulfobacteriota bacterium]|jgi:hypothetical protein|nr:MAG: hypothetical protein OS130_14865 [Thermodesulfobacteriota bacterium]